MIENLLARMADIIDANMWLAPLIALLAGMMASLLPCSLSTVPLIIGYVGGIGENSTKRALLLSLTFAAGAGVTFTLLGIGASAAGRLLGTSSAWWYILLGILMVLMALQVWGIFEFIPSSYLVSKVRRRGYIGAAAAGMLAGIFSSPCSTPVLVAVLAVAAGRGNILWGGLLLLLYSVGHGMLAVAAGTSVGLVRKLSSDARYGKFSKAANIIMGFLIILVGLYMFMLAF